MTVYHNAPRYTLGVVVAPTVEPVTLEKAMDHLNIDLDDRHMDNWLNDAIAEAREWCEGWLGRTLAPQTLELGYGGASQATTVPAYWQPPTLNPWAAASHYIALPYGPVSEIVSVIYHDAAGDEQTMDPADYQLVGDLLLLASGVRRWPAVAPRPGAIAIRYIAGFTLPEDALPHPLPFSLKKMILLALGDLYDNRGNSAEKQLHEIPLGAKALGEQFRLRLGMA